MKKLTALLLVFCITASLFGCSSEQPNSEDLSKEAALGKEFFQGFTMNEYEKYLYETFYSLIPRLQSYRELGVGNLVYNFGREDSAQPYDELQDNGVGDYWIVASKIPVFYGAIKRAMEYESKLGVDNSASAEKHGRKYAVKKDSVDEIMGIIFRKKIEMQHESFDSVTYLEKEGLYIFDALIDPYQQFYNKGWQLKAFAHSPPFSDDIKLGENEYVRNPFTYVWLDSTGMLYELDGAEACDTGGKKLTVLSDISTLYEQNNLLAGGKYYLFDLFEINYDGEQLVSQDYAVTGDLKVSYITVGRKRMEIGHGPRNDFPSDP